MEKLLHLFDTLWFNRQVLSKSPPPESAIEIEYKPERPTCMKVSHLRSQSDQLVLDMNATNLFSDGDSPKSVLHQEPKLETVFSGKEFLEEKMVKKAKVPGRGRGRRKKGRRSKSLTEMELNEVKGFMDLGFVFSEEDREDTDLVSMIPGLRRHGEEDMVCEKCTRCVRKGKIPLRVGGVMDELEMKIQIKLWAHSVASAVR